MGVQRAADTLDAATRRPGAEADPNFTALKSEVRRKQQTMTTHPPAATEAAAAAKAAIPPQDDKQAQGKVANAEKMNAAKPGQSASASSGVPWSEIVTRLVALPAACRVELRRHADRLIDRLPESDEGELLTVLRAVASTGQEDVIDLALRALTNPYSVFKEDYALIVGAITDGPEATRALEAILQRAADCHSRPDLPVVLRTLHTLGAEDVAPSARPFVASDDLAVRGEAIGYLYDCDTAAAAPVFMAGLAEEADLELARTLLDGLVMWEYTDAIDQLRRLADDPRRADELRSLLAAGADELALTEDGIAET